MSQKNFAVNIMESRWSTAVAGAILTLIPARKCPAWLQHTVTWGSTAAMVALIASPRRASRVHTDTAGEETNERVELSSRARIGYAAVAGMVMYGSWKFAWWFDAAAERTLRKLRVPFPRVVLGAAVGAAYYHTDNRSQRRPDTHLPSNT